MITSTIISATYKGVELQAYGCKGCRYSCVRMMCNGERRLSGCVSIKSANEVFESDENIKKMVVYIYHPKKRVFEVFKYYER